eukprot:1025336-Pelagomonas_calceolata.AAC.8
MCGACHGRVSPQTGRAFLHHLGPDSARSQSLREMKHQQTTLLMLLFKLTAAILPHCAVLDVNKQKRACCQADRSELCQHLTLCPEQKKKSWHGSTTNMQAHPQVSRVLVLSAVSEHAHACQDGPSGDLGPEAFKEYGSMLQQDVQVL